MEMQYNRLKYIDQAKAVGILLMIMGHCYWKSSIPHLNNLIYSFHMPLFFIISGMFVKPLSFQNAIFKYSKLYLVPYFKISFLIFAILLITSIYNNNLQSTCEDYLIRILFASGSNKGSELLANLPIVCAFWFLFALFWGTTFFSWAIFKYDTIGQLLFVSVCFVLGCISIKYIRFPFSIQAGLIVPTYMLCGHFLFKMRVIHSIVDKYLLFLLIIAWLLAGDSGFVSISRCLYTNGVVSYIASIMGSMIVLYYSLTMLSKVNWGGGLEPILWQY